MTRLTAMACIVAAMLGGTMGGSAIKFICPTDGSGLMGFTSTGDTIAYVGETAGHAQIGLGDNDEFQNKTWFALSDYAKFVACASPNGKVILGDSSGWGNFTTLIVDDTKHRIEVNAPIILYSPDGTAWAVTVGNDGKLTTQEVK